ncbi:MAG: hypothetical protein VKO39_00300 [Cyanobacteriota bacterium]|nr:hypothetical protein [Cyanobacteriota bacterium]
MLLTGADLARAYLAKAHLRRKVLKLLAARQGWSDLVREAQELVELQRFPPEAHERLAALAQHSQSSVGVERETQHQSRKRVCGRVITAVANAQLQLKLMQIPRSDGRR